jgi:DNA ligase-1
VDADLKKLAFPIWMLPKIDGVRAMNPKGGLVGRSLKAHANKHVTETFSQPEYVGIDGEMAFGTATSASLCRDTTGALNRKEGTPNVTWWGFDMLRSDTMALPYEERYEALREQVASLHRTHLQIVPYIVAEDVDQLIRQEMDWLLEGFEGMILRDPKGMHKHGRATVKEGAYLRRKPWADAEALVLDIEEAMQNNNEAKINELGRTERSSHKENLTGKGMIGSLVCKDLTSGIIFNVGPGEMTHEARLWHFNHPETIVGHIVTYKSLQTGVKDKPRMATFKNIRAASDMS